MSSTRQTTLWCDVCTIRHIELDVDQVSHARAIAKSEGWTRVSRHGDRCPSCSGNLDEHGLPRTERMNTGSES